MPNTRHNCFVLSFPLSAGQHFTDQREITIVFAFPYRRRKAHGPLLLSWCLLLCHIASPCNRVGLCNVVGFNEL